jgi:hypothetical protein
MRVIEKNIISTIKSCMSDSFSRNETFTLSMRDKVINLFQEKIVYSLWEHPIFELRKEEKDYVIFFSFCNWASNTTKSRLNSLLSAFSMGGFFQKDWEIYYTSSNQKAVKIDTSKAYKIVNGQVSEV